MGAYTPTEGVREIVALLASGMTRAQAATRLSVSPHTLNRRIADACKRAGAATETHLCVLVLGIVPPAPYVPPPAALECALCETQDALEWMHLTGTRPMLVCPACKSRLKQVRREAFARDVAHGPDDTAAPQEAQSAPPKRPDMS